MLAGIGSYTWGLETARQKRQPVDARRFALHRKATARDHAVLVIANLASFAAGLAL